MAHDTNEMMQPAVVDQKEQVVIGLATRTTNEAEADPARARLGRLWGRVMGQDLASHIPHQAVPDALYAVLTDYETDHRGEYTQIVGMAVTDLAALPGGLVGVAIPAGRYLVFTARGPVPETVIQTWRDIWAYFSGAAPYERAYTTDYEVHRPSTNPNDAVVEIHLAITPHGTR